MARGVKFLGRVEGTHMLQYGIDEAGRRFKIDSQKMLDKLLKDLEV
jgi:hypothetical protein